MSRLPNLTSRPVIPDARERSRRSRLRVTLAAPPRGIGLFLYGLLLAATGVYGSQVGGTWPALVAAHGTPGDMVANLFGFRVETVTIKGQQDLADAQILAAAGVSESTSLVFLDAKRARDQLEKLPLVKSATVHKLYPDTLAIAVEERKPYALWQKEGTVYVIAADGTAIDEHRDGRYANLPFVVGNGAANRAVEIVELLDSMPALKTRVRAAVLVAERRWNLTLDNGVVVRLPERDPASALAVLASMQDEAAVMDRDILSIDMRLGDRVAFRLGADALAARAAELAKTKKGGKA
jgi:cell division protein FtsQ